MWRIQPRLNAEVNGHWMCDEGRFTYHQLREHRLTVPTLGGLPASWDKALAAAQTKLTTALKTPGAVAVVLSAQASNEDNFALVRLARPGRRRCTSRPAPPTRAAPTTSCATPTSTPTPRASRRWRPARSRSARSSPASTPARSGWWSRSGHDLPLSDTALGRLRDLDLYLALASHELGPVASATVSLPIAAWAEHHGSFTNRDKQLQRFHAAVPAPGQAVAGWEAAVRLARVTGANLTWAQARDVWKDMTASVAAWKGAAWGREIRPTQLRFAGSRG